MSSNFISFNSNNLIPYPFAEETFSKCVLEELKEMFEDVREYKENRLEDYQEVLRWSLRENRLSSPIFYNIDNRFDSVRTDIRQFYYRGDNDSIRDIVRVLNRDDESDSDDEGNIVSVAGSFTSFDTVSLYPEPIYNPNDYGHCALCA